MKKRLICIALVLFASSAAYSFDLKITPSLGAGFSWYENSDTLKSLFDLGLCGGVMLEHQFNDFFGIKTGLRLKNMVIKAKLYIQDTSGYPLINLMYATSYESHLMLELPVMAEFYAGLGSGTVLYAGAGVKAAFVLSANYSLVNEDPANSIYDESGDLVTKSFVLAPSAEAGIMFDMGPGKVNLGLVLSAYLYGSEYLFEKSFDVELVAGYTLELFD